MRPATVLKANRRTILNRSKTFSEVIGQLVISFSILATYSLTIEA
jgi:hypothetical protein